jgi:hypothetical protein
MVDAGKPDTSSDRLPAVLEGCGVIDHDHHHETFRSPVSSVF